MFKSWIAKTMGPLLAVGFVGASGATAFAHGDGPAGENFRHNARGRFARAVMREVVEETGLEPCDITGQMAEGQTLTEVIEESGGSTEQVVDTLMSKLAERLDRAVENGRISEERAEHLLEKGEERLEAFLTTEHQDASQRIYERRCINAGAGD